MRPSKRSSLIHLIYFSRAQLSAEPQERGAPSQRHRPPCSEEERVLVITSLLIVDQGYFIQILEGERMSVQETFQRISGISATATCTSSSGGDRQARVRDVVRVCPAHRATNDILFQKANLARCSSAGPRRRARSTPSPRLCKRPWPSRASTTSSSRSGARSRHHRALLQAFDLTHFSRRPVSASSKDALRNAGAPGDPTQT